MKISRKPKFYQRFRPKIETINKIGVLYKTKCNACKDHSSVKQHNIFLNANPKNSNKDNTESASAWDKNSLDLFQDIAADHYHGK